MKPRDGSLWLKSIVRRDLWPPMERFEAYNTSISEAHKHSIIPEINSKAGIYAFKTIDDAIENIDRTCYRGVFLGRVHLWGVIQKHRFGYRAQFAYPHSLKFGICCICRNLLSLKSEAFAIGWASYHFSDDFSVSGFVCKDCNERYYFLNVETSYAELLKLAERYGIFIG